jgi:ABC-type branched-subunit amino acid transport system permease subunit
MRRTWPSSDEAALGDSSDLFIASYLSRLDLQYFISFINYLCITFIIVLGLQVVTGFCGQVSFGQAAFMAIGAYIAVLTLKFGFSFWLALPLSGLSGGVIGLIGGAPRCASRAFIWPWPPWPSIF